MKYFVLISNDNAMNCTVLLVNYDALISDFGSLLVFCKFLHYFVPGYNVHSCHLRKLRILSGQNLIYLCKQKKILRFIIISYITISNKLLWPSGIVHVPQ